MRISDWSSDVCSSDLTLPRAASEAAWLQARLHRDQGASAARRAGGAGGAPLGASQEATAPAAGGHAGAPGRSEEHTYELQSLMRTSYAVFCLKNKIPNHTYRQMSLYPSLQLPMFTSLPVHIRHPLLTNG